MLDRVHHDAKTVITDGASYRMKGRMEPTASPTSADIHTAMTASSDRRLAQLSRRH